MFFLSILVILLVVAYLLICVLMITVPILIMTGNRIEHRDQGDAPLFGSMSIFGGVCGLLFALALFTGEINFDPKGDTPKQGCWKVTTTREMVGKTMTDVRHWETIRCP